jgi:hypothetical protein
VIIKSKFGSWSRVALDGLYLVMKEKSRPYSSMKKVIILQLEVMTSSSWSGRVTLIETWVVLVEAFKKTSKKKWMEMEFNLFSNQTSSA